ALQYSFEGEEVAGEGVRSVFTSVLVHGLGTGEADIDADGHISLDELYEYVYAQVTAKKEQQRPQKFATLEGQIIIAKNPHWVVKPAELPPELQQAIENPLAQVRVGAVHALELLLRGSDAGRALAARRTLERMREGDDSRSVSAEAARVLGAVPAGVQPPTASPPPRTRPRKPPRETERYKILSADRILWKQDGKEMVRVPAGKFLYGDKKEERELGEFWIDKTPVTNAEYARFVAAMGHEPPEHWKGKTPPAEMADHPVVYVSWHDAVAYAEWAGKRLPSEEEWEKAARGTDGREYPWGDEAPTSRLCNFGGKVGGTTPVGRYSPPGDSPYGCVDMAGNVWEWTDSPWEEGSKYKVLRGGSWLSNQLYVRAAYRYSFAPGHRYDFVGFRCVSAASGR
ncbi:MAG: hypothetical protein DRJ03_27755, partial [Chloroflexi bacterium]